MTTPGVRFEQGYVLLLISFSFVRGRMWDFFFQQLGHTVLLT